MKLGGTFTFPGTSMTVNRIGYGAMQLPGPGVYGPPKDHATAIAVLREAIRLGINHIDTSDFYGPHVANHLIREALHPYPDDLVIVTKIGGKRGADKSWNPAYSKDELISAVHDNLRHLKVDAIDVVNLRLGAGHGAGVPPFEEMMETVIDLKSRGHIKHIGLSNVTPAEFARGKAMTRIVCVQNWYNVARRDDDAFIDDLVKQGVAYVPFFPVGGFMPLQSDILARVAAQVGATDRQVAQAWLLQRAPNMLLITGTSSLVHLAENASVAGINLPPDAIAALNSIAQPTPAH
ncbi:MAG: oxidoreductase [Alphaproteobacteria bacterium]|nr:oxidoreductase [Alphaproteobacteria bacterium]MBL6937976.1 oxidoreductase [Alphaproteobacteria bacterium]MBL7099199.1 oxidoreductase [Alphaproteobacteria bacterium]